MDAPFLLPVLSFDLSFDFSRHQNRKTCRHMETLLGQIVTWLATTRASQTFRESLPQEFRRFAVNLLIKRETCPKTVKCKFTPQHPNNKTAKRLRDSGAPFGGSRIRFSVQFLLWSRYLVTQRTYTKNDRLNRFFKYFSIIYYSF